MDKHGELGAADERSSAPGSALAQTAFGPAVGPTAGLVYPIAVTVTALASPVTGRIGRCDSGSDYYFI